MTKNVVKILEYQNLKNSDSRESVRHLRCRASILFLVSLFLFLILPQISFGEEFETPELKIPGQLVAAGTYFEITDSEYLNIVLKSSSEIKVFLESIPKIISLHIEAVLSETTSANLTLENLEPNKTYYQYQDSYQNIAVFISDENGTIAWEQDLTEAHHLWLQEIKSTIFITEDTVLTTDLTESVEISASNITLDCAGHQITGSGTGYGIYINKKTNVTIKNCNISNFTTGIYLLLSNNNNNILDNNISNSQMSGITLCASNLNNVEGNILVSNSPYGILLERDYDAHSNPLYSNNNSIIENKVSFSRFGINANNSQQNSISDNTISNITEWAITGSGSLHQIERNIITDSHGGLYIFWSQNSSYADNKISSSTRGILFAYSSGNILRRNKLSQNTFNLAFHLSDLSPGYVLQDIDITNTIDGKAIYYLVNKTDEEISGPAGFVGLINSSNITVKDLTLTNNWPSILLASTTDSRIENNTILNNYIGVFLKSSSNNVFVDNTITFSQNGAVSLYDSSGNLFYHNNFIDNDGGCAQVDFSPTSAFNSFDNGYPTGGNYWSDYAGADLKSGAGQDQPGVDGIGDLPQYLRYYSYGVCVQGSYKDNYPFMAENGWQELPPPEKWSFAIITDLHIGRGYPDYDGLTYEDNGNGEEYYLTVRLRNVVDWIIKNKDNIDCGNAKCSIQFLAVLGDITNAAEKSQFLKAKEILDKLNDPNGDGNTADGIPYVPVFGNHDVWPYTDKGEAASSLGEIYFDEIFWNENATNTKLIQEKFNNSFQRDDVNKSFKNFAFSYKDMNFIGLDFDSREQSDQGGGVKSEGNIFFETENWLRNHLNEYQGKEKVVIFSHHPFADEFSRGIYVTRLNNFHPEEITEIKNLINDYENIAEGKQILGTFGGHVHGFEKLGKEITKEFLGVELGKDLFFDANWEYPSISTAPVITTEALMVAGNEKDISNKGIIRIVKVNENNEINYLTTEGKFPTLNPYISWSYKFLEDSSNPCVFFKSHPFTHRDISSYQWQFGDGITDYGEIIPLHCYSGPGTYNVISTLTDTETRIKESITRKVEIKEGLVSKIIKLSEEVLDAAEVISQKLEENLLNFGNYLIKGKDILLLKIKHSPSQPVGEITVDFDVAEGDIDLSQMIFDTSTTIKKSILYMPSWPKVVDKNKVLFIPK